jgi:hypothetical protein
LKKKNIFPRLITYNSPKSGLKWKRRDSASLPFLPPLMEGGRDDEEWALLNFWVRQWQSLLKERKWKQRKNVPYVL